MTATRSVDELPGPRGLPLVANALQLRHGDRMHLTFEEWCRRYGPIFRVGMGRRLMVGIGDEQAINEILRERPHGYRRWTNQREAFEELGSKVLGEPDASPGVFAAEGEDWKRQRRLVVTALNTNHLHRYFDIVRTATERLHRRLLEAARDTGPLKISELLSAFTVDVTAALALGHDLNTLERGDSDLHRHIQRVLGTIARRSVAPIPYWRWVRLPADRAFERSLEQMNRAVEGFISRARERLEAQPERYDAPENLLEGLLAAQKAEGTFTDGEIAANVRTILSAGEDTTSRTLGWTMWLLGSRPSVQERLAEEAAEVLEGEPLAVEYEATERLDFTEAVLRESMRLKNVAPMMGLEPTEERTICGTRIPADTQLLLLLRHAAHGRDEEFNPERWREDSKEARAHKSLTFGAGPRFCPGRNLAFLEAKAALAMIARNFEWELDESGGAVRESIGPTMVPRGLRVRLRKRGRSS